MRRLSILVVVLLTLLGLAPAVHAGTATPPGLPQSMAAAGDSITRGFDATSFGCFLVDCPVYSWSTGTSPFVHSHYSRIRAAQPGVPVTAVNVARTGAKMAELDGQLQMVRRSVQYVTVLMGANDVCTSSPQAMTPTATFRASFATALANFFENRPKTYVFVSSIPDVYRLWSVLQGAPDARNTWRSFGICQSMLSEANDEATRLRVRAQEMDYNRVLAEVCAAYARCRWDGGATFGFQFSAGDVSPIDYFHPSVGGQAKLAAVTWAASFWPNR